MAYLDDIYADMTGANEVALFNAPTGPQWTRGAMITMGIAGRGDAAPSWWNPYNTTWKSSSWWQSLLPWWVIYPGVGSGGTNWRVCIKRIRVHVKRKSTGAWALISDMVPPANSSAASVYPSSLAGSPVAAADFRREADGSVSYKPDPLGRPIHGWTSGLELDFSDVDALYVNARACLVIDDPALPDDRSLAKPAFQVGGDAYVYLGQRNSPDFDPTGYTPGCGASKFVLLPTSGADRVVHFLPVDPPGWNGGGDVPPYLAGGGVIAPAKEVIDALPPPDDTSGSPGTPAPTPPPAGPVSTITKANGTTTAVSLGAASVATVSQALGWTPAVGEVLISAGVTFRGGGNSATTVSSAQVPTFTVQSRADDFYGSTNNRAWSGYSRVTSAPGGTVTVTVGIDSGATVFWSTVGFTNIDPTSPVRDVGGGAAENGDQLIALTDTNAAQTGDLVFAKVAVQQYGGTYPYDAAIEPQGGRWTIEAQRQTGTTDDPTTGITCWRLVADTDERDSSGRLILRFNHALTSGVTQAHVSVFRPAPAPTPAPTPTPSPSPAGVTSLHFSGVQSSVGAATTEISADYPATMPANTLLVAVGAGFAGGASAALTASDTALGTWSKTEGFANYPADSLTKQSTSAHARALPGATTQTIRGTLTSQTGYSSLYGEFAAFSGISASAPVAARGTAKNGGALGALSVATSTTVARAPAAGDLAIATITAEDYSGSSASVAFSLSGWNVRNIRTNDTAAPPRAAWAWKVLTSGDISGGVVTAAWSFTPALVDGIIGATVTVFCAAAASGTPAPTPGTPAPGPAFVPASPVPVTVAGIYGKRQPRLYGVALSVAPPCIDAGRLIYKVSDAPLGAAGAGVSAVYDRGVALANGGNALSLASLLATAPAAGSFVSWDAGGVIRLGASPAGMVTADVVRGAAVSASQALGQFQAVLSVPYLLRQVAWEANPGALVSDDDVVALAAVAPWSAGLWVDDESTAQQVMDRLAQSIGAWYRYDLAGVLRMGRIEAPAATPVMSLTSTEIVELERLTTRDYGSGQPVWQVRLSYQYNHTRQTDFASSVSLQRRAELGREYRRTVTASDQTVRVRSRLAVVMQRDTLLLDQAAAEAEAQRLLALYKVPRAAYSCRVRLTAEQIGALRLGSTLRVVHNRLGLAGGRNLLLIGVTREFATGYATLSLWG